MNNYLRGRVKEYEYRKLLLAEGWKIVQRSASSKSPVDIWCLKDDEVLIVQVKRSKTKNFSYKKDLAEFVKMKVPISVFKKFVVWVDKIGWIVLYQS